MTRRDTTENENGFWGTYPPSPPVCDAIFEGVQRSLWGRQGE